MELPDVIMVENGIVLIRIPRGKGVMGVNGFFQKGLFKPQIEITINHDFYLSETPITSRQWKHLGMRDPSRFPDDNTPVESVSRRLALRYISNLNKKYSELEGIPGDFGLPTEAEWEYSARAEDRTKRPGPDYLFGGNNVARAGSFVDYGSLESNYISKGLAPRAAERTSANAWGLKGMLGDVAEHCADPYIEGNQGAPRDGSVRKGQGMFIGGKEHWAQRGGSFDINSADLNYYIKAGIDMDEADARDGIRVAWYPKTTNK